EGVGVHAGLCHESDLLPCPLRTDAWQEARNRTVQSGLQERAAERRPVESGFRRYLASSHAAARLRDRDRRKMVQPVAKYRTVRSALLESRFYQSLADL